MLLRYPKEIKIRICQEKLLRENYSPSIKKLIVFLTPGYDIVNGGILSISSIYEETEKLKHIHGAETVMCTIPGDPLLLKYTKFENQNHIYRFSQVLSYFKDLQSLIVHIPEGHIGQFVFVINLSIRDYLRLNKTKDVHFNILIQSIKTLAPLKYIKRLKKWGKTTCTTAHEKYSTLEIRKKLGIPLHKLSVYVSPEKYNKKKFFEKEDLMIVSPDKHPKKSEVINLIAKQFPQLKIQIINKLTYEEYKNLISQAKWALTFGEGLDGYFVETIFSGGVSFSVYNPLFFTEDFKSLRTVYENYDILVKKICSDMKDLNNEMAYAKYQKKQCDLCSKHYKYEEYTKNLELFYKGKYTYG
jgi:hypothetical protein